MNGVAPEYPSGSKAVLRYGEALFSGLLSLEELERTSRREGLRILTLQPYQGVRLCLLDETTGMSTGTYKSLEGCVTTAFCRRLGYDRVVFSSGANAGRAMTEYGRGAGIETFFFCPSTTLYKLSIELFEDPLAHLISVEGSDRRVKHAAALFAGMLRIPLVPRLEWRILASSVRGAFIAERISAFGAEFHWFAQSICAGFGPIGVYRALFDLARRNELSAASIPRFLGVQQAALAPIAAAWDNGESLLSHPWSWNTDSLIEPSLYNTHPDQTYPILKDLVEQAGGEFIRVEMQDYEKWSGEYLRRLEQAGIRLTRNAGSGEVIEKAGLLAGAGVLKAIDQGKIQAGETVLCSLSGGTGKACAAAARPEMVLTAGMDLEDAVRRLIPRAEAG